jgi:hypothetical protein
MGTDGWLPGRRLLLCGHPFLLVTLCRVSFGVSLKPSSCDEFAPAGVHSAKCGYVPSKVGLFVVALADVMGK